MTDFETTQTIPLPKKNRPNLDLLVPELIREKCRNPQEYALRVIYDGLTLQNTYFYELQWEEEDSDEKYEQVLKQKSESSVNLQLSFVGGAPAPVDMECDGPCKRVFPSNLLNTIGRCGHYLCNACFGIVKNSDGTNGCSSFSCYWKGSSREEAAMYYEKEVCKVQRARARNMKKQGIDVKSASETFWSKRDSATVNTTNSSKTSCSLKSVLASSSSTPSPTPDNEEVGVKLVIVEPAEGHAMLHTFTYTKSSPNAKIAEVISRLLDWKRETIETAISGTLYYTEMTPDNSRKMRRVHTKHFKVLDLSQFPQIDGTVVFVLDLGGFIEKGNVVYLK